MIGNAIWAVAPSIVRSACLTPGIVIAVGLIELWNRPNKFGWTPLAIAVGYRFGNFKPSPETEAAVRDVMIAAGVTPPKTVTAKTQQIY